MRDMKNLFENVLNSRKESSAVITEIPGMSFEKAKHIITGDEVGELRRNFEAG